MRGETELRASRRDVVLTTPRLTLTSWLPEDADALLAVHSDPETMRFVRHGRPESRAETEGLVAQYVSEHDQRGWTKWRLTDEHGRLVGRAGFGGDDGVRELAFLVRRSHWGRGLATEVAAALLAWHDTHGTRVPLRAVAAVGNDASIRVLEKVGLRVAGNEDVAGTPCVAFVRHGP